MLWFAQVKEFKLIELKHCR